MLSGLIWRFHMVFLMSHEMLSQFKLIFSPSKFTPQPITKTALVQQRICKQELGGYTCNLSPSSNGLGAQRSPGCEAGFLVRQDVSRVHDLGCLGGDKNSRSNTHINIPF